MSSTNPTSASQRTCLLPIISCFEQLFPKSLPLHLERLQNLVQIHFITQRRAIQYRYGCMSYDRQFKRRQLCDVGHKVLWRRRATVLRRLRRLNELRNICEREPLEGLCGRPIRWTRRRNHDTRYTRAIRERNLGVMNDDGRRRRKSRLFVFS